MRIILAIFKDRYEAYTSLKPFYDKYPQFKTKKSKYSKFWLFSALYGLGYILVEIIRYVF